MRIQSKPKPFVYDDIITVDCVCGSLVPGSPLYKDVCMDEAMIVDICACEILHSCKPVWSNQISQVVSV